MVSWIARLVLWRFSMIQNDWPCTCHNLDPPHWVDIDMTLTPGHMIQNHTDHRYRLKAIINKLRFTSNLTHILRCSQRESMRESGRDRETERQCTLTLTVFEGDGVPMVPVLAVGTAGPHGIVQAAQTLPCGQAAGRRVWHVNVPRTLTGSAYLSLLCWVSIVTRSTPTVISPL